MAGSDGLRSACTGPRLGVPGFQDFRAPQGPLPRPEPHSTVGTTFRPLLRVGILGAA